MQCMYCIYGGNMDIDEEDATRLLQVLKKETGGKLLPRKKIINYIKVYMGYIPPDIRKKYTIEELFSFLKECWDFGTFDKW